MPTLAPLLAGFYFVVELAAANRGESLHIGDLRLPILMSVGFALLVLLLSRALVRTWERGAVLATAVVFAFCTFGYAVRALEDNWALDRVFWAEPLLLAIILALLGLALAIRRTAASLDGTARALAILFAVLNILAVGRSVAPLLATEGVAHAPPLPPAGPAGIGRPPDIYLIVPDKYTGSLFLAKHYGFDNRPFERFLAARGFVVPREARANYMHTFLALAAMLNARYLDDLPQRLGPDATSRRAVDGLVEANTVMAFLRERGYRIVFTPTPYPTTRRNRLADIQIPPPRQVQPEFATAWIWTTPIPILHEELCLWVGCSLARAAHPPESAELIDWKFAQLEQLAGGEQPTFAFVHLTVPHEPYIYWGDCGHRPPYWPDDDISVKSAYIEQIQCINRKLERLVTALLERSPVPPVILIQSDHGHGRVGRHLPDLASVPEERRDERASIFAAYHLPGVGAEEIPATITPVNAVRLVLRTYFGAPFPALADDAYWSSTARPYRFAPLEPAAPSVPVTGP